MGAGKIGEWTGATGEVRVWRQVGLNAAGRRLEARWICDMGASHVDGGGKRNPRSYGFQMTTSEGAVGRNYRPLLLCGAGLRFMAVYCLGEFTELEEWINGS